MKRTKEFIVKLFSEMFTNPSEDEKKRRLTINQETGKINWSEGELPLGEGPDEEEIAEAMKLSPILLEDDPGKNVRLFKVIPIEYEVFRKNRFEVDFPGIQPHFFQAYRYMGTSVRSEKRLFRLNKIVKDEYSSFKVLMIFPHEFDICNLKGELIPQGEIPHNVELISRNKQVVIHCRSGARSGHRTRPAAWRDGRYPSRRLSVVGCRRLRGQRGPALRRARGANLPSRRKRRAPRFRCRRRRETWRRGRARQ